MKEESLDPRVDRMMAALYGELSESEARAFHRLLETDEGLRAEWEELRGMRQAIAGWEVKERVPRFVLLEDAVPRRARAAEAKGGGLARWLAPFRALRGTGGFALVAAAAAGVAFLAAEARFERRLEARLGTESRELAQSTPSGGTPRQRPEMPIEDLLARPGAGTDASPLVPASGTYVTRAELEADRDEMLQSLAVLLNQYDQREDQETLDLLQAMYERINRQQLYDFRQLAGRVDNLGRELILSRSVAEQKIEDLLGPEQSRESGAQGAPAPEGE